MSNINIALKGIRQRKKPMALKTKPTKTWTQEAKGHVKDVPIAKLKPYKQNARTHSSAQIDAIARSFEEFGFVNPVLIDGECAIIAGHGRLEAAKRLGWTRVPTILLEHLSPEQVRAYRIADNRIAELSDWNAEILQLEIADLAELQFDGDLDFDLTVMGYNTPELDLIIGGAVEEDNLPTEIVEEPDPDKPAVTQIGDLWVLGNHRLLCGNSLEVQSYTQLLSGDVVRTIFTDPPYNVPICGHVRAGDGNGHREFAMASGEMSGAEFRDFLFTFLEHNHAALQDGGIAMICMDWRHIEELIATGKAAGFDLINLCVWNKNNGGMGSLYRSKHELVAVFKKPGAAHVNNVELGKHGRYRTNVWDYAGVNSFGKGREADLVDHPTVKPTNLVADAIMDVSHRGEVVLDVFGGSGATLLAAEQSGRCARMIELDPLYCDVTIRRWQSTTGQDAVHARTGERFAGRELAGVACIPLPVEELDHG